MGLSFRSFLEARHDPSFYGAMYDAPGDRTAWGVFADWAEENGSPGAAALFRLGMAAATEGFCEEARRQGVTPAKINGWLREVMADYPEIQYPKTGEHEFLPYGSRSESGLSVVTSMRLVADGATWNIQFTGPTNSPSVSFRVGEYPAYKDHTPTEAPEGVRVVAMAHYAKVVVASALSMCHSGIRHRSYAAQGEKEPTGTLRATLAFDGRSWRMWNGEVAKSDEYNHVYRAAATAVSQPGTLAAAVAEVSVGTFEVQPESYYFRVPREIPRRGFDRSEWNWVLSHQAESERQLRVGMGSRDPEMYGGDGFYIWNLREGELRPDARQTRSRTQTETPAFRAMTKIIALQGGDPSKFMIPRLPREEREAMLDGMHGG